MKKIYIFILATFVACFYLCAYLFIQPKKALDALSKEYENHENRQENGPQRDEELLARIKQEVLMTKDPQLGYVPSERLEAAREQLLSKNRIAVNSLTSPPGSGFTTLGTGLTWAERGPNNIGGRCRAVLVDKSDGSGNTVLVGSVSGGLWRTTNFSGATPGWAQISTVAANLAITTLAQDPTNSNILYAGTGEGYFNQDAVRGLGIYKSTDGGLTWSLLSSTTTGGAHVNDFNYVQKVAVYSNGDVYASGISATFCNAGGVLKSTDGGSTWTRVIGTFAGGSCANAIDFNGYDIEFSTGGDIYASVIDQSGANPAGKIYKSSAGATVGNSGTWTNVAPSAGVGNFWQRIQIACSLSNNNLVYAIFQGTGNSIGAIQRSADGGTSWTDISSATTWCDGGTGNGTDFSRGQAWYDLTLTINPANDADVYAGGVDIMQTADSGKTWAQLTQWSAGSCAGGEPYVHADIHNITFIPGSSTHFVVGCDGGIFYTTNTGGTFITKDMGLNVTQYYAAALYPSSGSNYMLAGAQDNGSHVFNSAGINTVTTATGGDGTFCFIDQNSPSFQLTSFTNAEYARSTNGGASFTNWTSSTNGRFVNPADYDNTTQYLYCGYTDRILRRIGIITTGFPTRTNITVTGNTSLQVSAVKVDPNASDSVWVAFSTADDASADQAPQLYVIGGASTGTRTITQIASLSLSSGSYVSSIDVEKGNDNHLLLTVSNYGVASVWESADKGTTWTSLDNNGINLPDIPIRWGLIVPSNMNVGTGGSNGGILLATELGVWSTTAPSGASTVWTQNASGMGNVSTYMLRLRTVDNLLVAATHGRGLFTTNLASSPLPVTFISFNGKTQPSYNSLFWSVTNEVNNKGYEVEREYAGETQFSDIGFVEAKSANALSDQYSFNDLLVDLGKGDVFYRLKQIDLDGSAMYSSIITLTRNTSTRMVQYISVSGNSLFIRINNEDADKMLHMQIMDLLGRVLTKGDIPLHSQSLDIGRLARGVYMLKLMTDDHQQFVQKFLK
jgi:hypothetical protein